VHAIARMIFSVRTPRSETVLIDVKTTAGEFGRAFHISFNEVLQIANGAERYDIYRVYDARAGEGRLRVCSDVRSLGQPVLRILTGLPTGISADGVSVSPERLTFAPEIGISIPDADEEQA
jgi:hypothetical protein